MHAPNAPRTPTLLSPIAAVVLSLAAAPALAGPDAGETPPPAGEEEVLIFVTSWCPVCREATSWLQAQEIPHLALDVESDPRAMALYRRAGGDGAVPLILVGPERIRGFEPRAVQRALDRQRAAGAPASGDPADEPAAPGVEERVGEDGKVHLRFEAEDVGGEVHGPQVEFVTTRPDGDEASMPDPALDEQPSRPPIPDRDEDE